MSSIDEIKEVTKRYREQAFEKGAEAAVDFILENIALDCHTCPSVECFRNKNADCKTELLKLIKEYKGEKEKSNS